MRWVLVLGIALVACADAEWRTFYGIEYRAPKSSTSNIVDSVLPGPDGQGGSPTGERPVVTISAAGEHAFYVTITKSSYAMTLDGEKTAYVENKIGANLVGTTTPGGWELTGDLTMKGGGHFQEIYVDLAGGHYLCNYGDSSQDQALAERVCRSIRAK